MRGERASADRLPAPSAGNLRPAARRRTVEVGASFGEVVMTVAGEIDMPTGPGLTELDRYDSVDHAPRT